MSDEPGRHERWARFRFAVIGPLLASPPEAGDLHSVLCRLAAQTYKHPITGQPLCISVKTIERWLYRAAEDPVNSLRRRLRRDAGKRRQVSPELLALVTAQYAQHPRWTYQLHHDNLAVVCAQSGVPLPAYATVRRAMQAHGMYRVRRGHGTKVRALREVRSFEAAYVHGLWHADFHHGQRNVLLPDGTWVTPKLLCILDDRSRLCCHAQWYLTEDTEVLVHSLIQAICKRGLPRALLTDNGSAFIAAETKEGLARLSVIHVTTLPESPYQNGKQEAFFGPVEGRLIAMLEGVPNLTLAQLNEATQAWVELEHNREPHSEIGCSPIERFLQGPTVGRPAPTLEALRCAFCQQVSRKQRRSDGTLTVEGVRFELPGRYRHLQRAAIRYRSWDLRSVLLVDPRTDVVLCQLFPLDRAHNADGYRRPLDPAPADAPAQDGIAPLLRKLLADYAATGLPPAYLPLEPNTEKDDS